MRHILSRSLLTVAAASSILAATGGYASADSDAQGATSGSPGVLSGDSIEAPVDVPVNLCGNSANVVGSGNAAFGNSCTNESHSHAAHQGRGGNSSNAGSGTKSETKGSPGVLAGNSVDIPIHAPLNVCGNTVDPVALLNAVMGNSCGTDTGVPTTDVVPLVPPTQPRSVPPNAEHPTQSVLDQVAQVAQPPLAETGVSGGELGTAGATSAALLLGGAMLYRRGRGGPRPAPAYAAGSGRHRSAYS